jgi:glycosyltransferase involved in cell wall biosynthesis
MKIFSEILEVTPKPESSQLGSEARRHGLLTQINLPFPLPTPVYGAMLAIWHLLPTLQSRFPLHNGNPKDYVRFLAWCSVEGRHRYAILRAIPEWDAALSAPISLPALKNDSWSGGYSVAVYFYGIVRYRYFLQPMLKDCKVRHRVTRAFWRGERHNRQLAPVDTWHLNWLAENFSDMDSLLDILRVGEKDAHKEAPELLSEFGLEDFQRHLSGLQKNNRPTIPDEKGRQRLETDKTEAISASSFNLPNNDSIYIPLPIRVYRELFWLQDRFSRRPTQFQLGGITRRIANGKHSVSRSDYPFGVNLFGYAKGELGIGEDVRLVATALKTQGIPFCIVNVKPGDNVSQKDTSAEEWLVDAPQYAINIFCSTGVEQVRYGCEKGLEIFEGRYTIGFWPWELPKWPASCEHAYAMVDEIWGISEYTANAYRYARCPVIAMSLPVTVDKIAPLKRKDFGLADKGYYFIFSFDLNSTIARKNPGAVIQAFQKAFPVIKQEPVKLVIKISHVDETNAEFQRIMSAIASDSRIQIIPETLRRSEVLALYSCCDCFVSLHRAEGFGRGLAEALLLNLQVVTTGYSGNLDFCTDDRVGLVRYNSVPVGQRQYFHADGQFWADPDIEHAATLMEEVYRQPRQVNPKLIDFSPESLGLRYARRLNEIKYQLKL